MNDKIIELAEQIVEKCAVYGLKVSTAESITGGMISAAITSVPGSSAVIEFGVCSYSNRIKRKVLGVSEKTLKQFTEYSKQCAEEMAKGALKISGADFAVATSGIAGPLGGTPDDPVGTVYICACDKRGAVCERATFENKGRDFIREAAAEKALSMLLSMINEETS